MRRARTFVIAEAGVNHNGSVELGKSLVDAAVEAGADAVKFQTFTAENVVSRTAPKADYQRRNTGSAESQLAMIKALELDVDAHRNILRHCEKRGIQFLSSPFDLAAVELLANTLHLSRLKIGSGEITNGPLLLAAARTRTAIILSTGMSTLDEVETALGVLAFGYLDGSVPPGLAGFSSAFASPAGKRLLRERVVLLHCTSEYPAPFEDVNLEAMDTLGAAFDLPVGLSDHTPGIAVPIAAVARGAVAIEKHLTLDSALPGPDHKASLEPDQFKAMVDAIREIELALGSADKKPTPSETGNRDIARRSLVAARPIRKGEPFTELNLAAKRPGTGISAMRYWEWIGRVADRDYSSDELIAL